MRGRFVFSTALAAVALVASVAVTADTLADVWVRARPFSGTFSVETPCTAQEIETLRRSPPNFAAMKMTAERQVVCIKPGMIMAAGEVIATNASATGQSAFDAMVGLTGRDPAPSGTEMILTIVNGRRAMMVREVSGQKIVQIGFIETGHDRIITVITGFQPENTNPLEEKFKQIDRFVQSIELAGK